MYYVCLKKEYNTFLIMYKIRKVKSRSATSLPPRLTNTTDLEIKNVKFCLYFLSVVTILRFGLQHHGHLLACPLFSSTGICLQPFLSILRMFGIPCLSSNDLNTLVLAFLVDFFLLLLPQSKYGEDPHASRCVQSKQLFLFLS
uniref:Uncharacterized protein n=1 Tax=Cacopsylla melanoneura TaxID=428564 RepID=A0A8D8V8W3_9HEMI